MTAPTAPDTDRLTLVLEEGGSFDLWTNATISDDFLTPCQTMSVSIGVDESRFDLMSKFQIGTQFRLEVNGNPIMAGFLDSAEMADDWSGGVSLNITGRDVLSPVVDSNIDPSMQIRKEMSLFELAQKVFVEEFDLPITVFDDANNGADKARNISTGKKISAKPKKGKKTARDPLKDLRPHANEGGFQYFLRFAHRAGFHAWAMPDGSGVVIGTPTYEQPPSYTLRRLRATSPGRGGGNNIEKGSAKLDYTHVPSHVFVRGKGAKPGDKFTPLGYAVFDAAPYFKPFYVTDDESSTKEHADAVARFTLGKALRTSLAYNVTVRGMSDPATGAVYTVDTVVDVQDERIGINGLMWIEQRTFRKSRAGTFTDLKLIPADSLLMGYYVGDGPPPAPKTYGAIEKKKRPPRSYLGWKVHVVTWDAKGGTSVGGVLGNNPNAVDF
jgi:prophage tail gpP-like protein